MSPITYTLIRSNRKSLAIQITKEAEVVVRAPRQMSVAKIEEFIIVKNDWIVKNKAKMKATNAEPVKKLTKNEIAALYEKAKVIIPKRVEYYASIMGVSYGRITIRKQRSCWGSCSARRNLNFNCLLMLTPMEVIDSVVVHELCHLLEMNHSKRFYSQVYRVYPEYERWNKWLKTNGKEIMRRG